jgi:hypothetical protein
MSQLSDEMVKLLGPSWKTTLLGISGAALEGLAGFVLANAFPGTSDTTKLVIYIVAGLKAINTAIRGYYQKDVNVSNSPDPIPVAKTVPPPKDDKPAGN